MFGIDIEVLKGWIASLIRLGGAGVIAWLISKGYLTEESASSAVLIVAGAVAVLLSSLIGRVWTQNKINTALELPAGSSKTTLKNVIENQ